MEQAIEALTRRYPERRAIVTGAASGLGLELCRRFAGGGWTVGMLDANREALAAAEHEVRARGGVAHAHYADVTDYAGFSAAVEAFTHPHGGLDLMINNAGVAVAGPFVEIPLENWQWILGINLMGVVHGCRLALPLMQSAGRGLILNVASAAGFFSSPTMSAYNCSKAAVVSLSETLFGELLDSPIQVSVALPTFVKTHLLASMRAPAEERTMAGLLMQGSDYTPEQAVGDILRGVAAGDFYIFVPAKLKRYWRFKRYAPMRFLRLLPRIRRKRVEKLRAHATGPRGGAA